MPARTQFCFISAIQSSIANADAGGASPGSGYGHGALARVDANGNGAPSLVHHACDYDADHGHGYVHAPARHDYAHVRGVLPDAATGQFP